MNTTDSRAAYIARRFHETYERLAPSHGYETRKESAVPWDQVPESNRELMVAVVDYLMSAGDIYAHVDDYDAMCSTFCCAHRHALSCKRSPKAYSANRTEEK